MNKINKSLESAQNDQKEIESPVAVPLGSEEFLKPSGPEMEEEMMVLYYTIDSLLSGSEKKVIQFIGSNEGEGTSTITREFARVVSEKFGKSVLLLDTDIQKPSQILFFDNKTDNKPGYSSEGEPVIKALDMVQGSRFFLNPY